MIKTEGFHTTDYQYNLIDDINKFLASGKIKRLIDIKYSTCYNSRFNFNCIDHSAIVIYEESYDD